MTDEEKAAKKALRTEKRAAKKAEWAAMTDDEKAARRQAAQECGRVGKDVVQAAQYLPCTTTEADKTARRQAARDLGYVSPTSAARQARRARSPSRSGRSEGGNGSALRLRCLARKQDKKEALQQQKAAQEAAISSNPRVKIE